MDREADFDPAEEGLNVTVIVTPCPADSVAVAGDTLNCEESVPVAVMLLTVRFPPPLLLIVNVFCDVDPTFVLSIASEMVDRLMTGADGGGAATPLPASATEDGLPVALWAIDKEAPLSPAEVGVNVTVIVWLPLAETVAVVGDTANIDASVPLTVIPVTFNVALPVLLIVNVFCDVDPTVVLSIASEVVESEIAGA